MQRLTLQILKETEIYKDYHFHKNLDEDFDAKDFWLKMGFLEYNHTYSGYNKEENQIYASNSLTKCIEYDGDISELVFPMVLRATNLIYRHVGSVDLDIDEMINNIHERLDMLLEFYEKMFPNIDWQAECCATLSLEIGMEIVNFYKTKENDPEKFKFISRERKLKRITKNN